jgi:sugar-specific transcriptional regulator TrmB
MIKDWLDRQASETAAYLYELEREPVRNKHLENFVKGRLNAFSETKDMILGDQTEAVSLDDRETFFEEVKQVDDKKMRKLLGLGMDWYYIYKTHDEIIARHRPTGTEWRFRY